MPLALTAIYTIQRTNHLKLDYSSNYLGCVNAICNSNISMSQLKEFELKCKLYKQLYDLTCFDHIHSIDCKINKYLSQYKIPSRMFITSLENCYLCGLKLDFSNKTAVTAVLFSAFQPPEYCFNFLVECRACNTKHYQSYCTQIVNKREKRFIYKDSLQNQFMSFTKLSIYETRLFELFSADVMYKHTSYQGFVDAYNSVFCANNKVDRQLNDHRFTECWLYFNLLLYIDEFGDLSEFEAPSIEHLDAAIEAIRPQLFQNFVKKWNGSAHTSFCNHEQCSSLLNVDGNWKLNRLKCMYDDIMCATGEVGNIPIGCRATPKRGSYFCEAHEKDAKYIKFKVNGILTPILVNTIQYSGSTMHQDSYVKIHDYLYVDNMKPEDTLFLVETKYPDKPLKWIKRKDISTKLYMEFIQSVVAVEDDNVYEEVSCNTNKTITNSHVNKDRTRGVLISSYNCGIINGYRELYGCESVRQVILYYCDLLDLTSNKLPKFFIYDDACHLSKYLINNKVKEKSTRGQLLSDKRHYVDKLHIKNHTDEWCLNNCDPNKVEELKNLNTVVCEQINFWLSRFKYIVKHMNFARYQFFLFIILDMHNKEKIRKQKHEKKKKAIQNNL